MAIVATEIESIHGATTGRHLVFYKCQDSDGVWHRYGPVIADAGFDAEANRAGVGQRVESALANEEIDSLLAG